MPKFYDEISQDLAEWALKQSVFWTATAPLVGKHINISPKGLPSASFAILGGNQAAYIDYTGSGSETVSHLYENGRITILFNSFDRSPRILRLFCTGRVVEAEGSSKPEFQKWVEAMQLKDKVWDSARAVIILDVWKVQTSCGYGVPIVGDTGFEDRETLEIWGKKLVDSGGMKKYLAEWNSDSLDGLVGLKAARRAKGERFLWWGNFKAWSRRILKMKDALGVGLVSGVAIGVGIGTLNGWMQLSSIFGGAFDVLYWRK
ncbi:hypothetical protein BDZ91DRAFT_672195 [Kalaharituber pfeilii]|nr:hypothetical protein BDZ91DRAFT_672195 [Kalaharituber pfeilii]